MKEFTIKQVADIAGVSKNAIRFRISKHKGFATKYMHVSPKNRTRLISNEGTKKLLGKLAVNSKRNTSNQLLTKQLISEIDDLRSQRDKSNAEVSRLTSLLNHEQELNLTNQSQLKELKGRTQHGFIWRLFH